MERIIKEFAADKINSQYDVCLVIVMSHGCEEKNDTAIYGIDENYIFASFIIKQFTNENCESWRDKPKILVFQVCRYLTFFHCVRFYLSYFPVELGN